MNHHLAVWNVVPVRLVIGGLALAGVCGGIGLQVPAFGTLAFLIYGVLAIGLTLYGLLGTLAAPFEEGIGHGIACILLPPFYPIYFHFTHPEVGRKPFVNLILGFALIWVGNQLVRRNPQPDPPLTIRPIGPGENPIDAVGPTRSDPDPPGVGPLTTTTSALAKLLAGVTDESTARRAAPRYRQLMTQRSGEFAAAGEPRALDDRGNFVSISALVKFGPRFRDANRDLETQRKRVRREATLFQILEGIR